MYFVNLNFDLKLDFFFKIRKIRQSKREEER